MDDIDYWFDYFHYQYQKNSNHKATSPINEAPRNWHQALVECKSRRVCKVINEQTPTTTTVLRNEVKNNEKEEAFLAFLKDPHMYD